MSLDSVFEKLDEISQDEQEFLQQQFVAPVIPRGTITVAVGGLRCDLRIQGVQHPEWAVLRPRNFKKVRRIRQADRQEIRQYKRRLPNAYLTLVAFKEDEGRWLATPTYDDPRFNMVGYMPVYLVEDGQMFKRIQARFDGIQCWYDSPDRRQRRDVRDDLSRCLREGLSVEHLSPECFPGERRAYEALAEAIRRSRKQTTDERIRQAVEHAGGELVNFIERADGYSVRMKVDGKEMPPVVVDKERLGVKSAGFCLNSQDSKFDLPSIITVWREGAERHRLHVFNQWDDDDEEEDNDW